MRVSNQFIVVLAKVANVSICALTLPMNLGCITVGLRFQDLVSIPTAAAIIVAISSIVFDFITHAPVFAPRSIARRIR